MESRFSKRKATISGLSAVLVVAVALVAWARQDDSPIKVATEVLGAQVVKADGTANENSNGKGADNGKGNDPKGSFALTGQADGLYPGAVIALPLTVTNPQSFGIRITELTIGVGIPVLPSSPLPGVSLAPACTSGAVQIGVLDSSGQFRAQNPIPVSVTLGKNGFASMPTVRLRMVASPPDACQGATFPLSYGGSAVKS